MSARRIASPRVIAYATATNAEDNGSESASDGDRTDDPLQGEQEEDGEQQRDKCSRCCPPAAVGRRRPSGEQDKEGDDDDDDDDDASAPWTCNGALICCVFSVCMVITLLTVGMASALHASEGGETAALSASQAEVKCLPLDEAPPMLAEASGQPDGASERRLQVGPESSMSQPSIMSNSAPAAAPAGYQVSFGHVRQQASTAAQMPAASPEELEPAWLDKVENGLGKFLGKKEDTTQAVSTTVVTTCIPVQFLPTLAVPSGHCDSSDLDAWTNGGGADRFEGAMQGCVGRCPGSSICVSDCIQLDGYSRPCSRCFGELAACTGANCYSACATTNPSADSACSDCVRLRCNPGFWACTGLDREVLLDALGG